MSKFRGQGDEFLKVIICVTLEVHVSVAGFQIRGLRIGDVCVLQVFGSSTV